MFINIQMETNHQKGTGTIVFSTPLALGREVANDNALVA